MLYQAHREASEVESSIKLLTEECSALSRDLQRQGDLVTQRDEALAMLRDEAFTSWASRWLAFQHRSFKAFPREEEAEESSSESEADPGTFSDAPRSTDCPGDPEVQAEASSPSLHVGALSSVQSPASNV